MMIKLSGQIRYIMVMMSAAMITGCSFLSPVKPEIASKYVINSLPATTPIKKTSAIRLLVSAPEVRPVYNTTQMAYSVKPYQISYFSQNQWAETPGQMFHPLLVQTLLNTHFFKTIVTPPSTSRYDYVLNTEILELTQDFTCKTPVLRMGVRAQLMKIATNQVVATNQFTVLVPLPQSSPYGGVYAANAATKQILGRITGFCLVRLG